MPPRLTVVVPWVNRGPWIDECLERLEAQSRADTLELVVYARFPPKEAAPLADRFPRVRFGERSRGAVNSRFALARDA